MWALTAPSRQYTEAKHGTFLLNLQSARLDTSARLGLHDGRPTRCALSRPRQSGAPWSYFPPLLPVTQGPYWLSGLRTHSTPCVLCTYVCFFYIGFSALRSSRGCFLPINSLSVLMRPSLKGLPGTSSCQAVPSPPAFPPKHPTVCFSKLLA